jgi:hypothetical protein
MFMRDFEKLGVFYLGKIVNPATGKPTEDLLLYDSKDLTTHAVCVGMTGSGKTGLGITILEEAGIDKIPAIIIDPKGDLSNLLLTFPNLSSGEFLPWIDEGEAERNEKDPKAYAETVAKNWREGLEAWGEGPERIQNLRNSVAMTVYTPASRAGVPLSILSSFSVPPKELMQDAGALRDRILSITSSLLGLIGIEADPIKSREHILISTIIDQAWKKEVNLDIASLIQQVQKPPFDKIGVLDIDTFFSAKDRLALSISLNNLLASPGFHAWMEGEPLDIKQLLYTKDGKPKLSIISIAHLSNSERMFFITLLLNELLSWMRRQTGTSSLRALFYMDEIFGYFPPTSMPPSKLPMLTLLKQARAFGLGIVLATQNPVDLDYKGLANCGTWFIGKLQTERDKARVIEGLNVASNGEIDSKTLDKMLAATGKRMFIMRSIHEKEPILFQTRWTLSYLRGPLTLAQIDTLTDKTDLPAKAYDEPLKLTKQLTEIKPVLTSSIQEFFFRSTGNQKVHYKPQVAGLAKLHFVDSQNKIDAWEDVCLISPVDDDGKTVLWDQGKFVKDGKSLLDKCAAPQSTFNDLPAGLMQEKNYSIFEKTLAASLYQNQTMNIYKAPEISLTSNTGESEADFRARITLNLREKRDEMIAKVRAKYTDKIAQLSNKLKAAQEKLLQKQQQANMQKTDTLISIGTTLLGALFGRKLTKGTISQAGTSIRRAEKIGKGSQEATIAEDNYQNCLQQLNDVQTQLNNEIANLTSTGDASSIKVDEIVIRPRKSDIAIEKVGLVWLPE